MSLRVVSHADAKKPFATAFACFPCLFVRLSVCLLVVDTVVVVSGLVYFVECVSNSVSL